MRERRGIEGQIADAYFLAEARVIAGIPFIGGDEIDPSADLIGGDRIGLIEAFDRPRADMDAIVAIARVQAARLAWISARVDACGARLGVSLPVAGSNAPESPKSLSLTIASVSPSTKASPSGLSAKVYPAATRSR